MTGIILRLPVPEGKNIELPDRTPTVLLAFIAKPQNDGKIMAIPKRNRADSAASAVKAMVNASKSDLQPPEHNPITESARPYWIGVVRARARDEWSEVDLVVAAQLAQCQADMAEEDEQLRLEGRVVKNDKGNIVFDKHIEFND